MRYFSDMGKQYSIVMLVFFIGAWFDYLLLIWLVDHHIDLLGWLP